MVTEPHQNAFVHDLDAPLGCAPVKTYLRDVADVEEGRVQHQHDLKAGIIVHEEGHGHKEGPPHQEDDNVSSNEGSLGVVVFVHRTKLRFGFRFVQGATLLEKDHSEEKRAEPEKNNDKDTYGDESGRGGRDRRSFLRNVADCKTGADCDLDL